MSDEYTGPGRDASASTDGSRPVQHPVAAYAGAPVLAGDTPILSAGPVTGVGAGWTAPGWRNKLNYMIREPGWSHDGSRDTSSSRAGRRRLPPAEMM